MTSNFLAPRDADTLSWDDSNPQQGGIGAGVRDILPLALTLNLSGPRACNQGHQAFQKHTLSAE